MEHKSTVFSVAEACEVQGLADVKVEIVSTRKYPLRGYILGVLTHTTAWDRNWGVDETLKLVLVYVA